jgi:hypothetical protein
VFVRELTPEEGDLLFDLFELLLDRSVRARDPTKLDEDPHDLDVASSTHRLHLAFFAAIDEPLENELLADVRPAEVPR